MLARSRDFRHSRVFNSLQFNPKTSACALCRELVHDADFKIHLALSKVAKLPGSCAFLFLLLLLSFSFSSPQGTQNIKPSKSSCICIFCCQRKLIFASKNMDGPVKCCLIKRFKKKSPVRTRDPSLIRSLVTHH